MEILRKIGFTVINKRLLNLNLKPLRFQVSHYVRLAEVGRFELPKIEGDYEAGQLFLHAVFGYRGVVLFPWVARVYDRDFPHNSRHSSRDARCVGPFPYTEFPLFDPYLRSLSQPSYSWFPRRPGRNLRVADEQTAPESRDVKGREHTFYQVLIDARDCPFIRAQTEAVTFLGSPEGGCRSLYAIPGLDYVSHQDIWPYASTEKQPVYHELFDKFLYYNPSREPPFLPQETLKAWQKKNHPWLELSDVHKETTENIRVTVIPFYMGSRDNQSSIVYWWRYCIRIENLGEATVQLRERHWRIFSLSGTLETVRGRGVVGQEPVLSKALPAFQYSSHVSLQAPSGHMWGTFRMEREDGYTFDCRIPPFSLESKSDDELANPPLVS